MQGFIISPYQVSMFKNHPVCAQKVTLKYQEKRDSAQYTTHFCSSWQINELVHKVK